MKISGNAVSNTTIFTDEYGDFMYFGQMQVGEKGFPSDEDFTQTKISETEALCELCGDPHTQSYGTKFYLNVTILDSKDDEEEYFDEDYDED